MADLAERLKFMEKGFGKVDDCHRRPVAETLRSYAKLVQAHAWWVR
jgi:hypothetical protein